jgi:transcriptional regulator with XRE-family HTH domain
MSNLGNKEIMAENLKYYIERRGISQKDFAEIVGVSTSTVNDWVKAKKYPRIDKIELAAAYFGILKSDLIEKRVTEEMGKNSDIAVDITIRLGSDIKFRKIVKRAYEDNDFFELADTLCNLDSEQILSVKAMLGTLLK